VAAERRGLVGRATIGWIAAAQAVACASSLEPARDHAPLAIASSAPSGLSLVWRNTELHPIKQPMAIGDVVIGVVADDRKAFVVSIDASTGRKLWQQRMTHSGIARGLQISVTKIGEDKVAYLQLINEDSAFAHLVVADARTGREIARSPEAVFASRPIVCANGRDVCAISTSPLERKRQYRLDLTSGAYVVENDRMLRGTRFIDETGLLDLGDRPGNTVGLLRNGRVQWLTPLAAAFADGSSTDDGWSWNHDADQRVYIGWVGSAGETSGQYYVHDLASSATAGLSELTGEVLWRDNGSSFACSLNTTDYRVRCRMRGKLWYRYGESFISELDVTVEGFDPVTGKTTWSLPLGFARELNDDAIRPAVAGPGRVVVSGARGPAILDYANGTLDTPEPGATFWCMARVRYELAPPYRARTAEWKYTRRGGTHASICDERGRPATALPSIAATMAAGARAGDHVVIATRDGFLGFKAPRRDEAVPALSVHFPGRTR
jgi:outer membrane protein assembly factor BamB